MWRAGCERRRLLAAVCEAKCNAVDESSAGRRHTTRYVTEMRLRVELPIVEHAHAKESPGW